MPPTKILTGSRSLFPVPVPFLFLGARTDFSLQKSAPKFCAFFILRPILASKSPVTIMKTKLLQFVSVWATASPKCRNRTRQKCSNFGRFGSGHFWGRNRSFFKDLSFRLIVFLFRGATAAIRWILIVLIWPLFLKPVCGEPGYRPVSCVSYTFWFGSPFGRCSFEKV